MNWLRKGIENQSVGLLPILLFMFLDNFFDYRLSFMVAVLFCALSITLYYFLRKDSMYLYMLMPATVTLVLYSLFMCLQVYPVLYIYSPIVIEMLLVGVLSVAGFFKRTMYRRVREMDTGMFDKFQMRSFLNEFYFITPVIKRVYMLHLFAVLAYGIFPDSMQSIVFERFLLRTLPVLLGLGLILYEQLRLIALQYRLDQETWLPVLSDDGKVIGRIAGSVSKSVPKKYYHPVVRVMVVHKGLLYLRKREVNAYVSPGKWDTPYYCHIQFKQTIEDAARIVAADLIENLSVVPHFLVRYKHETEKVKHLVSLYAICLNDEQAEILNLDGAKFWTPGQIEQDLQQGVFSEYFQEEYDYLRNTVMLAECFCHGVEPAK